MKSVGIREFRDQATKLIASGETLAIEKHGEPVGFYVPIIAKDRKMGLKVLDRLDSVVSDVLEQTGHTEDELVAAITGTDDVSDAVADAVAKLFDQGLGFRTGVGLLSPWQPIDPNTITYQGIDIAKPLGLEPDETGR